MVQLEDSWQWVGDDAEAGDCEQTLGIAAYLNLLLLGGANLFLCLYGPINISLLMLHSFVLSQQKYFQVLIYLDMVEIPESLEEKRWKNRVEKVSQAIVKEQLEEGGGLDKEDAEEGDAEDDDDDDEGEVEEGEGGVMEEETNNGDKKADGWVEDPDSDIMDAKVDMVMMIMMVKR